MASDKQNMRGSGTTAAQIARFGVRRARAGAGGGMPGRMTLAETNKLLSAERGVLRRKVLVSLGVLAVLVFVSLGIMGAQGQYYADVTGYQVLSPLQVANALWCNLYDVLARATHLFPEHSANWITQNAPGYYAVVERAGVVGITLVCAVLLSVSGALYQAVFRNPIAGPGMLGVGSGVSLGIMVLVYVYNFQASGMLVERYALCYLLGGAILLFVILLGRKLSGPGRPFDIVTMLLVGSILSQLLGFIVSYVTLYVMDPNDYNLFYELSQMLTVDATPISWVFLLAATVISLAPVWRMRFKLNALSFDEQEVRLMGIDPSRMRALALVCGAIMILAAQIHIGAVGMVSLIVPFLARSWFGVEFRKQLAGNVCIGTVLLLACRDIVDLIPFVGNGIAIGSAVAVVALPLFLFIVAKNLRGWE